MTNAFFTYAWLRDCSSLLRGKVLSVCGRVLTLVNQAVPKEKSPVYWMNRGILGLRID